MLRSHDLRLAAFKNLCLPWPSGPLPSALFRFSMKGFYVWPYSSPSMIFRPSPAFSILSHVFRMIHGLFEMTSNFLTMGPGRPLGPTMPRVEEDMTDGVTGFNYRGHVRIKILFFPDPAPREASLARPSPGE